MLPVVTLLHKKKLIQDSSDIEVHKVDLYCDDHGLYQLAYGMKLRRLASKLGLGFEPQNNLQILIQRPAAAFLTIHQAEPDLLKINKNMAIFNSKVYKYQSTMNYLFLQKNQWLDNKIKAPFSFLK